MILNEVGISVESSNTLFHFRIEIVSVVGLVTLKVIIKGLPGRVSRPVSWEKDKDRKEKITATTQGRLRTTNMTRRCDYGCRRSVAIDRFEIHDRRSYVDFLRT